MKFPYIEFEIKPFPSSKRSRTIYRPVIPFTIFHRKRFVQLAALIDTGADYNTFHGEAAEYLGIKLTTGSKRIISGIGGQKIKGYEHKITLKIKDYSFQTRAIFSN